MTEAALVNNWLFAAMGDIDQEALRPALQRRALGQGEVLLRSGDAVDVIHFPTSAHIANVMMAPTGESLAVSTVGREGVTGLAAFMALEPVGWDAVTQVAGVVWSMSAEVLRSQAARSPALNMILLQATHQNQLEAHGQALCASFHGVGPRLARWLLTLQERTGLSTFALTQEHFATVLGVQRTTVVAAVRSLQDRGALARATRGRFVIRDRAILKRSACNCHARLPGFGPAEG